MKISNERHLLWMEMLKGIGDDNITAAAMHILSTRSDWPPDVALLRCTALSISNGELAAKSGAESWATILTLISGVDTPLSMRERKALDATGSLYDLKRSSNAAADRARYIDAYDALADRAQRTREMLPAVAILNRQNEDVPELPTPPATKSLPYPLDEQPDEDRRMTNEERIALFAELAIDKSLKYKTGGES